MSDWKYELDDGLIAFYEDGIQRSVDKVFDALNAAEKRIAELEAHNADLGVFIDQLIKAGKALISVAEWRWSTLSELFAWDALVKKWSEMKNEQQVLRTDK